MAFVPMQTDEGFADTVQKPRNLDDFFSHCYTYWRERGYYNVILNLTTNVVNALLMFGAMFFLTFVVDWHTVMTCTPDTCAKMPFTHAPAVPDFTVWFLLAICFNISCAGAVVYKIGKLYISMQEYTQVAIFFQHHFGISDSELKFISWDEVSARMHAHNKAVAFLPFDQLTIAQRITRIENYIVGCYNKGVMDTGILPWAQTALGFEFFLQLLIASMFNSETFQLRRNLTVAEVRKGVGVCAVITVVLLPFIFSFFLVKALVTHVAQAKSRPADFLRREWCMQATWTFREFNELPHVLEARLNGAAKAADEVLERMAPPYYNHLFKVVQRAMAGIITIVLLLSFINGAVLTYASVMDTTLVWWLSTALMIFVAASLPEEQDREAGIEEGVSKLVAYTHYNPNGWQRYPQNFDEMMKFGPNRILFDINRFYWSRLKLAAVALVSCFTMPIFLAMMYYNEVEIEAIVNFVKDYTDTLREQSHGHVGSVISYSTFNFKKYGNPKYGAQEASEGWKKSKRGKMERSFISFLAVHPTYNIPPETGGAEVAQAVLLQQDVTQNHSLVRSPPTSQPASAKMSPQPAPAGGRVSPNPSPLPEPGAAPANAGGGRSVPPGPTVVDLFASMSHHADPVATSGSQAASNQNLQHQDLYSRQQLFSSMVDGFRKLHRGGYEDL